MYIRARQGLVEESRGYGRTYVATEEKEAAPREELDIKILQEFSYIINPDLTAFLL